MAVLEGGSSVLIKPRSAIGAPKEVLALAVLLVLLGSGLSLIAVAVLTIGSGAVYAPGIEYVTAIFLVALGDNLPKAHGKLVQSPVTEV